MDKVVMDKKRILMMSLGHLSCDVNSGALPAILPSLISTYGLNYQAAAGLMFAFSCLSSIVQPVFGYMSDKISKPWFIPLGILLAGVGLGTVGFLQTYWSIFAAVAVCGLGTALFHPEGARYANKYAGSSKGTALSLFSVGGNGGFVLGPMLAVLVTQLFGLPGMAVFAVISAIMASCLLYQIVHMDAATTTNATVAVNAGIAATLSEAQGQTADSGAEATIVAEQPPAQCPQETNNWGEFSKLTVLIMTRSVLFVGLNTFIPLYWINVLGQSKTSGAIALAVFCSMGVLSNFAGGVLSDQRGYLWIPRLCFPLILPCILLFTAQTGPWTALAALIPLAFVLYAPLGPMVVLGQKYLARNIGFASGVTFGLATSMGGICAPVLGWIADSHGLVNAIWCMGGLSLCGVLFAFMLRRQAAAV